MTRPDQKRTALLADALRMVSGVVLLTALLVAPLNYGSTRPMAFETLVALAAAGGAAWLLACALGRSWPLPALPARIGIALIAVAGLVWIIVLPAPELPAFTRGHFARIVARWPNSVVPRDLPLLLVWGGAGVVSVLAFHDLARDVIWRRAIAAVIVLAGGAVAAIGLVQNATHASGIYWETTARMPGAFFGPFFHHTSAGAYLNTVWPLGLALALVGLQRGAHTPRVRMVIFGSLATVAVILAAHTAHISRFPQLVAAVALVAFVLWSGIWRELGRIRYLRLALVAVMLTLAVGVVYFGATRIGTIGARWNQLKVASLVGGRPALTPPPETEWRRLVRDDLFIPSDHRAYPLGDRGAMYATALTAIADRPWFGWGPGGWMAAAATHSTDPFVRTFFLIVQFTHNDLLQTTVEWGLVGAAGWVLLIPAALLPAVRRLGRRPAHDFLGAGAVVALGAVLVQSLIDFPLQIPAIQFNAAALAGLAWSIPPHGTPSLVSLPFQLHERV